jgi:hypothetical protein
LEQKADRGHSLCFVLAFARLDLLLNVRWRTLSKKVDAESHARYSRPTMRLISSQYDSGEAASADFGGGRASAGMVGVLSLLSVAIIGIIIGSIDIRGGPPT